MHLDLQAALKQEGVLWSEKARCLWQNMGDKNTRFFHKLAESRSYSNNVSALLINGKCESDSSKLTDHVMDFYKSLYFKYLISRLGLPDMDLNSLTPNQSADLEKPFSIEEIKFSLDKLATNKCPSPDGFPLKFYQLCCPFFKNRHSRGL